MGRIGDPGLAQSNLSGRSLPEPERLRSCWQNGLGKGRERDEGKEVAMADMLSHGTRSADYLRHERVSRSERLEGGSSEPLNPVVAWSIVLLGSFLLWWGVWEAISALVSALR